MKFTANAGSESYKPSPYYLHGLEDDLVNTIEKLVTSAFGSDIRQVHQHTRKQAAVKSRHVIFFLLYNYTDMTKRAIARRYGRHHATVIHGIRNVRNLLYTKDSVYYLPIRSIERSIMDIHF